MAIVFGLVVNYGQDRSAAESGRRLVGAHPPLAAGPHLVRLHPPLVEVVCDAVGRSYLEMSVVPARVGWGVALDGGRPRLGLTSEGLGELGAGLYALLARLTGYRVAQVGWDPEAFVDPIELRREWGEELASGTLPGLVVAEDVRLGVSMRAFEWFADGFLWIPYEGERP